jgi:hypothetical protein
MAGSGDSGDLASANFAASTAWGNFFAQIRMRPDGGPSHGRCVVLGGKGRQGLLYHRISQLFVCTCQ